MIIDEKTLSSSITLGLPVDMGWFSALKSDVVDWLQKGAASAWNYVKRIGQGGQALVESVRKGNFLNIFKAWAKEDPGAAVAGVAAAGLAVGTLLVVGGAAVAWVTGGLGAMAGKIGLFGAGATTASLGVSVSGLMSKAETIYTMNWQVTDKAIMKGIKDSINSLYNPAGEFLGRSMAGLIVGGLGKPPKVQINVRRTALAMYLNPEIAEDILDAVSDFAQQGIQLIKQVIISFALMKGRQGLKETWKKLPAEVRSHFPGLDEAVKTWGDEEKEPWSFENRVNQKVETIDDQRLKDAAEGFLSGFWNQFRDGVEKVYV